MAVFALSHASDYVAVIDEVPYGEDVSSGDRVYSSSIPLDTTEPASDGIRVPDILDANKLRFSTKKRRYRILKKRKLDEMVFVF